MRPCTPALALLLAAAPLAGTPPLQAQTSADLSSMEARGTLGPYRIGLNYTVRHNTGLVAAHYFYASHLKDIPLTGAVQNGAIELHGTDGSAFHLHFVGNGSNGSQPLTFDNSVGMSGTWTLGQKSLPVTLTFAHSTANPGERMYADVTGKSDAAFEAMVQSARQAILAGNAADAAKYIHFPLRVNTQPRLVLHNAAELQAHWSHVFPPALLAKLRADVPHEMFVHNGEAMLGDGELWFDDRGLAAINPVP